MPQTRITIEISASRVEVFRPGAGGGDSRCERFARAEWPSPHTTALPEVGAALTRILADLNIKSAAATIVFSTPGAVTGLTSCPASIPLASAEEASQLALANIADFPLEEAPSDTCILFTDKIAKPASKDAEPAVSQRHFIACADAEQRTDALSELVRDAGLSVERLVPAEAVALADAARLACAPREDGSISAIFWVGEHATALVVGAPGKVYLARTVGAGTENLAEVLCRPLRPRMGAPAEAQPVTLAHPDARTLLLTAGIPAPDANIPNQPTLAGSSLLPHLQPVVQRLGVEVKQSLRFGVPEAERANIRLRLAGPGAAVPGLGPAIERISGFTFAPSTESETPDALDSSSGGLIAAIHRCANLSISLLPADVRRERAVRRFRKALIAGAAVAMVYVGYEAADAQMHLSADRAKLASLNSALQSSEGPLEVRRATVASRAALTDAERRVRKALDSAPDWSAVLLAVSQTTPDEVRVTALDTKQDPAKSTVTLRGYIRIADVPASSDAASIIHGYVQRLEALPLFIEVRLGATQRASLAGHESQTFELVLTALPIPRASAPAAAAPAGAATTTPQAPAPSHAATEAR